MSVYHTDTLELLEITSIHLVGHEDIFPLDTQNILNTPRQIIAGTLGKALKFMPYIMANLASITPNKQNTLSVSPKPV